MKIHALSPARAAWAATAFARLPVEAQPIVSSPNAAAALTATATTRSLNDSDGWLTVSFFTQARATPRRRARAGASTSGVNPVSSDSTRSEERRVGKECRCRGRAENGDKHEVGPDGEGRH